MKFLRTQLLATGAVVALSATAANAQVLFPQVELRGAGATSVGDVLPRTANCIGRPGAGLNQYGTNSGQLSTVAPGAYNPTTPTPSDPAYDCTTQEIQPNFEAKYIGTGSGTGRQMWRTFTTSNLNGSASNINPFAGGAGNPSGWGNLQFAFSDAPLPVADLTTYNSTANNATNGAGAAIQVPFFVLPVAVAYAPSYGTKTTGGATVQMMFRVTTPRTINGVVAGGLKLSREVYCKIFNGEITNWNDPVFKTLNNNQNLFDATNDTSNRWFAEGAPIRLVGRADKSGTTDIFTRALAAQCNGLVTTNKFAKAAESLPFDNTSPIDIRNLLSSSVYFPSSSSSNFSGTVQSIGGLVYDRVNNVVCNWNELNSTTKQCDVTLAPGGVFTNAATPGLFMLADGSSGVAAAIAATANNALLTSTRTASVKLNGKIGYIGADWVAPVPGRSLHSAALQSGLTNSYAMSSAADASVAFGAVLPPETTSTSGTWAPYNVGTGAGDARQLGAVDPYKAISDPANGGSSVRVSRANPLHWAAVLYNPNVPINQTLAAPAAGYPLTGVTFMLTSTCFKPTNPAVPSLNPGRIGVVNYMSLVQGQRTQTSTANNLSPFTFVGNKADQLGIVPQSNIALPSGAWRKAIFQTFLIKSSQAANGTTLGNANLWIQDKFPYKPSDVNNVESASDPKSNPTCDATKGA